MNSTQHKWGTGHYHCGRKIRGNAPLIIALIIVLTTPIAFYVFVKYGPATRRVRERVITQRNITNTFTQVQNATDEGGDSQHGMEEVHGGSGNDGDDAVPGPSTS